MTIGKKIQRAKRVEKRVAISFLDFCQKILRVKLSDGQRVIAKVCYDGIQPRDLPDDEKALAAEIFGPDVHTVSEHARRIITIVAGRGSGKSSVLSSCRLLHLALTMDLSDLAPGEKGYCMIICPDLKTAKQTLEFVRGQAEASPAIAPLVGDKKVSGGRNRSNGIRQDGFLISRPDGRVVSVECLAATKGGRSVRGRSIVGVVLDECAFFEDDNHVVNDKEIFAALLPRMKEGSQVILASTPWADQGLLYDMFKINWGHPRNSIVAVAPTLLMRNTAEMRAAVAAMQLTDPEKAQQEFHAKFMMGGAGTWFDHGSIEAAVNYNRPLTLEPRDDVITVAGADLAFSKDNATLVVLQFFNNTFHLARVEEHSPSPGRPLMPSEVFKDFGQTLKKYKLDYVVADRFNEAPFREFLERNDMALVNTPANLDGKVEMFSLAKNLFREGRIELGDNPRLVKQFKMYTGTPLPGGKVRIDIVRKRGEGHGDLVTAFVAALWQLYKLSKSQDPELRPGSLEWHKALARRQMDDIERYYVQMSESEDEEASWAAAGMGVRLTDYDTVDWGRLSRT